MNKQNSSKNEVVSELNMKLYGVKGVLACVDRMAEELETLEKKGAVPLMLFRFLGDAMDRCIDLVEELEKMVPNAPAQTMADAE